MNLKCNYPCAQDSVCYGLSVENTDWRLQCASFHFLHLIASFHIRLQLHFFRFNNSLQMLISIVRTPYRKVASPKKHLYKLKLHTFLAWILDESKWSDSDHFYSQDDSLAPIAFEDG
jgi:hypothetical protein